MVSSPMRMEFDFILFKYKYNYISCKYILF